MNYFQMFSFPTKFKTEDTDRDFLEKQYIKLQKEASSIEGVLDIRSSTINQAYKTLKDDSLRAEYLLKFLGIVITDFKMPVDLVESILDIREDITDSESESEIQDKISDVEFELEEAINDFDSAINSYKDRSGISATEVATSFMRFKCLYEIVKKHKKQPALITELHFSNAK